MYDVWFQAYCANSSCEYSLCEAHSRNKTKRELRLERHIQQRLDQDPVYPGMSI